MQPQKVNKSNAFPIASHYIHHYYMLTHRGWMDTTNSVKCKLIAYSFKL